MSLDTSSSQAGDWSLQEDAYWNAYYAAHPRPQPPSPFALSCLVAAKERIGQGGRLVDLGCGDGRDAFFFAQQGIPTLGIDANVLPHAPDRLQLEFIRSSFKDFFDGNTNQFGVLYCRFVLHALTEESQAAFITALPKISEPGALLLVEARSSKGHVPDFTHYRRLVSLEALHAQLSAAGFSVEHQEEGQGLAVYKEEDPVVIRMHARYTRG